MKSVPPRGSGWVRLAVAHVTVLVAQRDPPATRVVVLTPWDRNSSGAD